MATARYAWGIDIGNRALKAIRLARAGGNIKIDDFDVIEHEQILTDAGENRDALVQASISAFAARHNLKSSTVAVGVSGQSSFARFIKLPPVERKQIPNIVKFEAIQQIPFPLDDVEWSYQLFEAPESPDVEVGIFAMRKELVAKHIQLFTDQDMNVSVVQMNPLADYNAMQFDSRLENMAMIIDMGSENTDLIIADNDSVWLRSIPIGGNSFTEALVKAFKLNFAKAEELKRTAGTSKYTRQIFQAMRPVFGDLVSEIQRSMGFFSSVRREARIKKIIALGGTFRLPNLLRYLQQNLQLDIERMDSFRGGVPSDPKLAATFNENMLSLAGAYGLALQGMGEGKIQSSLLPASIRRERMWREKTKWFGMAAAMMLVGTGIAYGSMYLAKNVSGGEDLKKRNDDVLKMANGLSSRWTEVETAGKAERDMINSLYDLTDDRLLWPNLLADLRAAVPEPDPAIAEGLAKWDADAVKAVPRDQRKLLYVYEISSQYVPDMSRMLAPDADLKDFAQGARGRGEGKADGVKGAQGFLLTIRCSTPYKNGPLLVQNDYISNLMKIRFSREKGKEYLVAKASIASLNKLSGNSARLKAIADTYAVLQGKGSTIKSPTVRTASGRSGTARRGPASYAPARTIPSNPLGPMGGPFGPMGGPFGPMGPSGAAAASDASDAKTLDPLTEEDVRQDWDMVVMCAVVIKPSEAVAAALRPASATTAPAAPKAGKQAK